MKQIGWLISKYLLRSIFPYFIFSWLLLSVILFVQQASRFSDIFFSVNIPASLVWRLSLALVPSVIAFTCPMAMLVGTIIGLSKMREDSELVAVRAAGVGTFQILLPIVIFGIAFCGFAFLVNLKGVPLAARLVREVALQSAIRKLESPIEPGVFNTEIAGYTIYVKGADVTTGHWTNIFIYNEDPANGVLRLITSSNGRIDTTGQDSEMVLENASVATIPMVPGVGKYVTENIGETRIAIRTRRSELIERLGSQQGTPEELGLGELSDLAGSTSGPDRIEAEILLQRRLVLSISPLIFCLLGATMVLRFKRGGRGFAILLALGCLVGYYLLTFLGEQLARTGKISAFVGGLVPVGASVLVIVWLIASPKIPFAAIFERASSWQFWRSPVDPHSKKLSTVFMDLTTGLRDFDLLTDLARYFLMSLGFLLAVFMIFTAFELWRYAGMMDGGTFLLARYLFYLVPFVYLQVAPSAAMIATIATYVIKSRQNEVVTWTSAGQSIYRLLVPCFLAMLFLGVVNAGIQEWVAPTANRIQDSVRDQIRNTGIRPNRSGKYWIANNQRIYSFELPKAPDGNGNRFASDNETGLTPSIEVSNVAVYEFTSGQAKLQSLYRAASGRWLNDKIIFDGRVEKDSFENGVVTPGIINGFELQEPENPFVALGGKPNHMRSGELRKEIAFSESDVSRRTFAVALQKRYANIFLPLVISLFTAPFALSLHRSGRVVTVGYAIGLWLVFTGVTYVFEEFGLNGSLSPGIAVFAPVAIFAMVGVYLLSRVRT